MPVGDALMGFLVYALALFLSQNSKGSQFLLELSRGPLHSLMMVEKNSSQRSEGRTNKASISAPGTLLLPNLKWFQSKRRMASKIPLVQIILTYFFFK